MADLTNIQKSDRVILRLFTGAYSASYEVEVANEHKIGFRNKKGVKMVFNRDTGKQVSPEPKAERFASYIEPYDAEAEAAAIAKRNKALRKPHYNKKDED